MIKCDTIQLKTKERIEFIDITSKVKEFIKKSGIKRGFVSVYTRHTTSGLWINENEEGLLDDIKNQLNGFASCEKKYKHDDFTIRKQYTDCERINGDAHIRNTLFNVNETIPIINGKMGIGAYQSIFFVELDGPREGRNVLVQVLGE